jgi:hypothetical protein
MSNLQLAALAGTDGFVDLVLADQQLVDAEFEAIVAAEWADPRQPTDPVRANPYQAPQHQRCGRGSAPTKQGDQLVSLGREAWRRQRSPPVPAPPPLITKAGDGYRRK